ncbi:hypothetical protein [Pleionea sp. CnH1-48]|uniref:HzsA-related protein n=1 Tax=Pleionea sp. CnH1-48 TaxID=2954494 RepID=UPI002097B1E5|nr:hypothetical protein [Pleionea sp. CnH1-48]MCO7225550.1 hypothetical protein [Pleionea sp. CnH1-48]
MTRVAAVWASSCLLFGCTSEDTIISSNQEPDPVTLDFAIAYIKRPVPVDEDGNRVGENLADPIAFDDPISFRAGATLILRDRAAPSAQDRDITTAAFQQNPDDPIPLYDVRDLVVSPDGEFLAFAMRAPEIENADPEDQPKWNIWTYELETSTLRRVITSDITAEAGHDIMPAFLPDGRIVFSSTRQRQAKAILLDEGKPQFDGQEETLQGPNFVLHVMNPDGSDVHQITFNQSLDLYPTVMSNGRIAYLHWDRNTVDHDFNLYSVRPDGRDVQLLYGRYSHDTGANGDTVEFFSPIEMPDQRLQVITKARRNMRIGGDMAVIDVTNFVENTVSFNGAGTAPAQTSLASDTVYTDDQPSPGGLFHSVFPLWDESNRLLVSWSPCLLNRIDPNTQETTTLPCTEENLADTALVEAPPQYSIWMWDQTSGTQLPVVIAEDGFWFTNPITVQPRPRQDVLVDGVGGIDLDQTLVDENVGVLHIRSVYDIDGVDSTPAGIVAMADPVTTPVADRPARFLRIVKAVAIPDDEVYDFDGSAFGAGRGQLMKEIIGYAPVEPDGSVKVKIPANIAFTISVLDQRGRRISPRHQNWLQLQAGEEMECSGCHTDENVPHGRIEAQPASINVGATTTGVPYPNSDPAWFPDQGETMAETYTRINGIPNPNLDVIFDDVWTDANIIPKAPSFSYLYSALTTPAPIPNACATTWNPSCRILLNYETAIQPIWEVDRRVFDVDGMTVLADNTCTTCHNSRDAMNAVQIPAGQLELSGTASPEEPLHFIAYRELLFGDNEQEIANGALVDLVVPILAPNGDMIYQTSDVNGELIYFTDADGNFIFVPGNDGTPTVLTDTDNTPIHLTDMAGNLILDGNGNPQTIPIPVPIPSMLGMTNAIQPPLRSAGAIASGNFFNLFLPGGSHEGRLTDAELRIIAEWVDIGAQYFNNPFDAPEAN